MSNPEPQNNRFQQLRWRLTLTYTGVTIAALLTVELILLGLVGMGTVWLINSGFLPAQLLEAVNADYAPILQFYLDQSPPDQEGVSNWLARVGGASSVTIPLSFEATDEMMVVSGKGELLAVKPSDLLGDELIGQQFDGNAIAGLADPLQAALGGSEDIADLYSLVEVDRSVVLAFPIWDEAHERVLGVLVAIGEMPTILSQLTDLLPILGVSFFIFTIVAGLAGTVYGFLAAHGPVRRLNQLSEASLAWSEGDFTVRVDDPNLDELGQLALRLNSMAQQLQSLLETRRELAVVEERNRLARDLHDSVKQDAFAAAAQISAARKLIVNDPAAAGVHIMEAENLINDLRRELTNLIQQLRPVALEGKGLAAALSDYGEDWSRQNGISSKIRVKHKRSLPLEIEQAVFSTAKEALANVARHSAAGNVEIDLVYTKGAVSCSIRDDGQGFDPGGVRKGVGLHSMGERVKSLDGKLTIESEQGGGTSISFAIPIHRLPEVDPEESHE